MKVRKSVRVYRNVAWITASWKRSSRSNRVYCLNKAMSVNLTLASVFFLRNWKEELIDTTLKYVLFRRRLFGEYPFTLLVLCSSTFPDYPPPLIRHWYMKIPTKKMYLLNFLVYLERTSKGHEYWLYKSIGKLLFQFSIESAFAQYSALL